MTESEGAGSINRRNGRAAVVSDLRDRQIGRGHPIVDRYERITFEKQLISAQGQALASFVCPGTRWHVTTTDNARILRRGRAAATRLSRDTGPGEEGPEEAVG